MRGFLFPIISYFCSTKSDRLTGNKILGNIYEIHSFSHILSQPNPSGAGG